MCSWVCHIRTTICDKWAPTCRTCAVEFTQLQQQWLQNENWEKEHVPLSLQRWNSNVWKMRTGLAIPSCFLSSSFSFSQPQILVWCQCRSRPCLCSPFSPRSLVGFSAQFFPAAIDPIRSGPGLATCNYSFESALCNYSLEFSCRLQARHPFSVFPFNLVERLSNIFPCDKWKKAACNCEIGPFAQNNQLKQSN